MVQAGDTVRPGQVLAVLDAAPLRAAVAAAQAAAKKNEAKGLALAKETVQTISDAQLQVADRVNVMQGGRIAFACEAQALLDDAALQRRWLGI